MPVFTGMTPKICHDNKSQGDNSRGWLESIPLVILSRPRRNIAAPCKPHVVVTFRVFDDLLEGIDRRHARAQVAVRDHVHHGWVFRTNFVAIIEFVFEFFKKFVPGCRFPASL
jgi:hypothetical protein